MFVHVCLDPFPEVQDDDDDDDDEDDEERQEKAAARRQGKPCQRAKCHGH